MEHDWRARSRQDRWSNIGDDSHQKKILPPPFLRRLAGFHRATRSVAQASAGTGAAGRRPGRQYRLFPRGHDRRKAVRRKRTQHALHWDAPALAYLINRKLIYSIAVMAMGPWVAHTSYEERRHQALRKEPALSRQFAKRWLLINAELVLLSSAWKRFFDS
jgi:hypothetical protein